MTPTMAATLTVGRAGGGYNGSTTVSTDIYIDGQRLIRATTPPAQRRKACSGKTGLA